MIDFTEEQIQRYSRHILLQDVGVEGQEKIMNARVLVVGAGGLGAPVSLYLAAAGIGRIGIVDADVVDLSNLQRQVIHFTKDVGVPKVESAKEKILAINPDVKVDTYHEFLYSGNALDIKMTINDDVIQQIIRQAEKDAPEESCGYLLGTADGQVTENYWMENIDHSEEHFSFAPKDQFAALKYARSKNLKILANWHSHPASPSRPSQEDLRLANDPTIRYAILSLLDGKHNLNSFRIVDGQVVDKEIHLANG